MPSKAADEFDIRLEDVAVLLSLHALQGGDRRGRRATNLEVIHRSALVILTASWEAYIESVAAEAVEAMAHGLHNALQLPSELKTAYLTQKGLHSDDRDKQELRTWRLADQGWRTEIIHYAKNRVKPLNTPKRDVIDPLFCDLLGIKRISDSWGRRGLRVNAGVRLDEWLDRRHVIAHGAEAKESLTKNHVTRYRDFLQTTVEKNDVKIAETLLMLTGLKPW